MVLACVLGVAKMPVCGWEGFAALIVQPVRAHGDAAGEHGAVEAEFERFFEAGVGLRDLADFAREPDFAEKYGARWGGHAACGGHQGGG